MNTTQNKFGFKIGVWIPGALALIILISLLVSFTIFNKTNGILDKKIAEAKEAARPADISMTIIKESSCADCFDIGPAVEAIKKENVKVNSEKTIEAASAEGKELISKFNIVKAPTLIITGEIEKNAALKTLWSKLGEIKNSAFIMRQVGAPYVLISTGEIRGRVKITMLKDDSCAGCYDVSKHLSILGRLGLPTADQGLIDINSQEGKKLTDQYKIKLLPTVILTGDIDAHLTLKQVWPQVGTIEKDGAYIFREGVKNMGTYKDLTANKIINPAVKSK